MNIRQLTPQGVQKRKSENDKSMESNYISANRSIVTKIEKNIGSDMKCFLLSVSLL